MSLYDVLACPKCKASLAVSDRYVTCTACSQRYPVEDGVPILLPGGAPAPSHNEAPLTLRAGYDPWVHRMVLQSLADNQVVLDAGCGDMTLDDPCIIRMDVRRTPYVDVVGDLHCLPFKPNSLDYIFSLAVLEHLRQPFEAATEMFAALKPGGYVYGECNFIIAYHGYPHHYFNASLHGLQQVFAQFTQLRLGVAPYQMPSFALENILSYYVQYLQPVTEAEHAFREVARHLLRYPLRSHDARFAPDTAFRLAAGGYFLGLKQPLGHESVLPPPVLAAHRRAPNLQKRYPRPHDLALPDNLMMWAKTEGRAADPTIAAYLADLQPFSKHSAPGRAPDRTAIHNLPPIPDPDQNYAGQIDYSQAAQQAAADFRALALALDAGLTMRGPWGRIPFAAQGRRLGRWGRTSVRVILKKLQSLFEREPAPATEAGLPLATQFARRGPWLTQFVIDGQPYGGDYDAQNDPRLTWFFDQFPQAANILELGSFEGGHTFGLAARPGVQRVLALEARPESVEKARFVQGLLGVSNAEFVVANLEVADLAAFGRFDAVFCVGLLYHLPEPWRLIEKIAGVSKRLFIWTHYAHEAEANLQAEHYVGARYGEHGRADPLSGVSSWSFWPTRASLLTMLRDYGFNSIHIVEDHPRHPHGPCITLAATVE